MSSNTQKSNCRISKVRYKTGQVIDIIPKKVRTETSQKLIDTMFKILNNHPDPKAYMLIVLDKDGSYSTAGDAKDFPFGYTTFVTMIKSLIDRDTLVNSEVKWFCKQQGWIE